MNNIWFRENQTEGHYLKWKVNQIYHQEKTPYQNLTIADLVDFGRALILDGAIQVTEKDEFIYNEMISHIPMLTHPAPREVLVIGGGDGGVVREVLKHPLVKHVTLCEIDKCVIEASKAFLPSISCALGDSNDMVIFEATYKGDKKNDKRGNYQTEPGV